jgi:hypothetical protein
VAGNQVIAPRNFRHTTSSIDALNVGPKQSLTTTRENQRSPLGLIQTLVGLNARFNPPLQFLARRFRRSDQGGQFLRYLGPRRPLHALGCQWVEKARERAPCQSQLDKQDCSPSPVGRNGEYRRGKSVRISSNAWCARVLLRRMPAMLPLLERDHAGHTRHIPAPSADT